MAFSGKVVRGYHCPPVQQPYWNMIDLAYDTVFAKFSKKEQKKILEDEIQKENNKT